MSSGKLYQNFNRNPQISTTIQQNFNRGQISRISKDFHRNLLISTNFHKSTELSFWWLVVDFLIVSLCVRLYLCWNFVELLGHLGRSILGFEFVAINEFLRKSFEILSNCWICRLLLSFGDFCWVSVEFLLSFCWVSVEIWGALYSCYVCHVIPLLSFCWVSVEFRGFLLSFCWVYLRGWVSVEFCCFCFNLLKLSCLGAHIEIMKCRLLKWFLHHPVN